MDHFEIIPYVGVGALRFGMSRQSAHSLLTKPQLSISDPEEGLIVDHWEDNGLQLAFTMTYDQLVLISMYSNIRPITLNGTKITWDNTADLFNELVITDRLTKKVAGITIFFGSGISTTGLEADDLGSKSITAFAKGQWSENDANLKPVSKPVRR